MKSEFYLEIVGTAVDSNRIAREKWQEYAETAYAEVIASIKKAAAAGQFSTSYCTYSCDHHNTWSSIETYSYINNYITKQLAEHGFYITDNIVYWVRS